MYMHTFYMHMSCKRYIILEMYIHCICNVRNTTTFGGDCYPYVGLLLNHKKMKLSQTFLDTITLLHACDDTGNIRSTNTSFALPCKQPNLTKVAKY